MRHDAGIRLWIGAVFLAILLLGLGGIYGVQDVAENLPVPSGEELTGMRRTQWQIRDTLLYQERVVLHALAGLQDKADLRRLSGGTVSLAEGMQNLGRLLRTRQDAEAFAQLRMRYRQHERIVREIGRVWERTDAGRRRQLYTNLLRPSLNSMRERLVSVVQTWEAGLQARRLRARQRLTGWSVGLGALTFLGLLAGLVLNLRFNQLAVRPLQALTGHINELRDREVAAAHDAPEWGLAATTARAFNRYVADRQYEDEHEHLEWSRLRQASACLVESYPQPAVVVDASGGIVTSNHGAREMFTGVGTEDSFARFKSALRAGDSTVDVGGVTYLLETSSGTEYSGELPAVLLLREAPEDGHAPS